MGIYPLGIRLFSAYKGAPVFSSIFRRKIDTPGGYISIYTQDFYPQTMFSCHDTVYKEPASWYHSTSGNDHHDEELCGQPPLQERIFPVPYTSRTEGAYGDKPCLLSATCCRSHAWRLRDGRGAGICVCRSKAAALPQAADSRGAGRDIYSSSASSNSSR